MLRVVVDTNVLVSGVLNPHGAPGRVIEAMLVTRFQLLIDDRIMAEYRRVLLRPRFGFPQDAIEALLGFIDDAGEHLLAAPARVALPDASDLPFLEVAIEGQADALVTGNRKHFRPLRGQHSIHVQSPASFVAMLTSIDE